MRSVRGSVAAAVAVAAGLGLGAAAATPAMAADWGGRVAMYRLYNPNSGEHFYTQSAYERDHLVRVGWHYEGVGWLAPAMSTTPVYRLYNPNAGDHHYTTSRGERDHLLSVGWRDEGIGWYSSDAKLVPLYRQYNPNARTGTHNYTTSRGENDYLVRVGWNAEGIGWYGTTQDAEQNLAKHYDPRPAPLTVAVGTSVDPNAAVDSSGLPEGTKFSWASEPDTSREGTASGTVTVYYPDGTTDTVAVTVTVRATLMADEYQPAGRRLVVKQGNDPNPHCALTNEGDLPEGTKLSWKSVPSTKATGVSKATLVATYPDGSSDAVTVTVEVQDPDTFQDGWIELNTDGITRFWRIKVSEGDASDVWGYFPQEYFSSREEAEAFIKEEKEWAPEQSDRINRWEIVGPMVCNLHTDTNPAPYILVDE